MKKLILIITFATAIVANGQDNFTSINQNLLSSSMVADNPDKTFTDKSEIKTHVIRNFNKEFPSATDDLWSKTKNGYLITFTSNGQLTRAFYSKNGNSRGIIRHQTEKDMPADVRHLVKSKYYDFTIFTVTEVSVSGRVGYLVTLEDKTSWKIVQVANGEMDVLNEYIKG